MPFGIGPLGRAGHGRAKPGRDLRRLPLSAELGNRHRSASFRHLKPGARDRSMIDAIVFGLVRQIAFKWNG